MATVIGERMSAEVDSEFVVFLIGIRINRIWKIHKWLPVLRARAKMLKELVAHPESGFMSHNESGGIAVLYWRTFEQLEYFARDPDRKIWPAWTNFNQKLDESCGDVGVWREIYVIKPGQYEAIYRSMPPVGLGKIGRLVPWTMPQDHAGDRLKEQLSLSQQPMSSQGAEAVNCESAA